MERTNIDDTPFRKRGGRMFEIDLRINDLDQQQREDATKSIYNLVLHLTSELNIKYLDSVVYTSEFKKDIFHSNA